MARGFLIGAVWGVVVSGVGAGALSVAMGPLGPTGGTASEDPQSVSDPMPVDMAKVETAAPETAMPDTQVSDPDTAEPAKPETSLAAAVPKPEKPPVVAPQVIPDTTQPGRRPVPEVAVDLPAAPQGALDAPEAPLAVGADTRNPQAPLVGAVPGAPAGGTPGDVDLSLALTGDAPIQATDPAAAPGAPLPEATLDISTDPAQPPIPAVPEIETALVADPEVSDLEATTPIPAEADAPAPQDPAELPGATDETAPEIALVPEPAPEVTPEPAPEGGQADVALEAAPGALAATTRPSIGKPAGSLINRDPAVRQSRLPSITDSAPETAAAAPAAESPLMRFAAKPDPAPTAGVPRLSVILIDAGGSPIGPEALKSFPFPLSFAIPPSHPDAAGVAKSYRELGFEVLALTNIPEGAQPSDVEVTLSATLEAVPGAVGIIEDPQGGVQSSRAVSTQTTSFLADSGHGLVMQAKGLNTAAQLAVKAGVPAVSLFRDLDKDGQNSEAIRRSLKQAAFRAKQNPDGVIMLGRVRADTISALIQWGLQDRNSEIALVPVSTVLLESKQ